MMSQFIRQAKTFDSLKRVIKALLTLLLLVITELDYIDGRIYFVDTVDVASVVKPALALKEVRSAW